MSEQTDSAKFYDEIPYFSDFQKFADRSNFHDVPEDWVVVITDIKGSTRAIGEGRYKEVNMVGAACIMAAINILKQNFPGARFPYVFGGDGATILVPEAVRDEISDALIKTSWIAEHRFGLDLRVGMVPTAVAKKRGFNLRVAKFRLSPGNYIAFLAGGGFAAIDKLIKDPREGEPFRVDTKTGLDAPDLEGLSCRWTPMPAHRDKICSLLINVHDTEDCEMVMDAVRDALETDLANLSPVTLKKLNFTWPPFHLFTELKTVAGKGVREYLCNLWRILFQSAFQAYTHKFRTKAGEYDAPVYENELIQNTDFRRFDDTIRLVLDLSNKQIGRLNSALDSLKKQGKINFGLHLSDHALMTCLVFNLGNSEHVHFMDGSDGGFALAAKQMKENG